MHHVRKIRELKERKHLSWDGSPRGNSPRFTMQMAAVNRKQVPLCKAHHIALHHNKLTPTEMELFSNGCKLLIKKNN
jgi:hypothetical protein